MSYRFTYTEKWSDAWFSSLKQIEMLLFVYLCDACDIAGFIEVNYKRWANDLGSQPDTIEGACKGLARGLIYSKERDCIFIKNFLKHQKNLPLNENNKAHVGIIKRFNMYAYKFDIQNINEFIEGASKGLQSPIGNGSGNECIDKGGSGGGEKVKTWRDDFSIYIKDCNAAYKKLLEDTEFIKEQQYFYPNLNIHKTIMKGYKDFWGIEKGWINKKSKKTVVIDWKSTIVKSIGQSFNKVYLTKEELQNA